MLSKNASWSFRGYGFNTIPPKVLYSRRFINQPCFKCAPYLGIGDMFLEISITIIDDLDRLKGMVYRPPNIDLNDASFKFGKEHKLLL